jgi:putative membrane protein
MPAARGAVPLSRWQWAALLASIAVFAATWIAPIWPRDQALHSSLTVVGLAWLVLHARRWPMRNGDFIAICGFIAVHCVAARWLYSNVPYDAWLQALLGWSPDAAFGWQRNHFDRLIHLLYGLCFTPAVHRSLRQRWPGLGVGAAFALAVMAVMCTSLVYEWAEWGIALMLSPEAAEAYNGQQGDVWDAHMDMLLATVGALLTWPLLDRSPPVPAP